MLSGRDSVRTAFAEVGYPYAVRFSICPDSLSTVSGVLFSSPHATFYTNWEGTGRLAFSRDGYTFVFPSYRLPAGQWTDIRIEGDYKGTSLYVNGRLQERLEGRRMRVLNRRTGGTEYMRYHETLVFPLAQLGARQGGFKGKLLNLTAEQAAAYEFN